MTEQAQSVAADPRYAARSISHNQDDRRLTIEWGDGHVSRFAFIWLRHSLFFPALGRPGQPADAWCLDPEHPEVATIASITPASDAIKIQWAHDDSTTRHQLAWLRDNCPSPQMRSLRQPKPKLWTGAEVQDFPWFEADDLEDPARRLELFVRVRDYGLALVRGVPQHVGTVGEIAGHFGPVRRTHHGSVFSIRSLPVDRQGAGQNIGATAANAQAPHTDEGFRHTPIGIMLFHCLKPDASGGGASLFCDGIAAAEGLRQSDPEAFRFLTTTPMVWAAERNPKERFRTRGRTIATDSQGVVRGVRASDRTFPPADLPDEQIEPAYRALRAYSQALFAPQRIYERYLEPGDMVVFDNHRVLHARRAFNPDAGERHIQQVSIDREEFHSIFRQLAEQQGRFDLANWEPDAGVLSQA